MLQTNARHDQAQLVRALDQVIGRLPEFVFGNVVLDDQDHQAFDQVAGDRLETLVAACDVNACGAVEQVLDFGGFDKTGIHETLSLILDGDQRSSVWTDEGWRHSGVTFMVMKGYNGSAIRVS